MPKIRRAKLPATVLEHLLVRAAERRISYEQIGEMSKWLDLNPTVPEGRWYKSFKNFTLCGEGELVKTMLIEGQIPTGQQVF